MIDLESITKLLQFSPLPHLLQLHSSLLKSGHLSDSFLSSKLIAAASLLDVPYAHSLLSLNSPPPLFAFNSLLFAHSLSLSPRSLPSTFSLFRSLLRRLDLSPDRFSFVAAFKSCARARALSPGRQLHSLALRTPHYHFLNLRNSLLHLYSSCGDISGARQVFDEMPHVRDPVSWSTLIHGYSSNSYPPRRVASLFSCMLRDGFQPNATALLSLLWTMSHSSAAEPAHGYCVRTGHLSDVKVATALSAAYVRCGCLDSARRVFEEAGGRDVVLYNCMVDGYAKGGFLEECLALLRRMRSEGVRPNATTFVGLVSACASSGALVVGRRMVRLVREENLDLDAALGTAVLDMYVKCGCIEEAAEVFGGMNDRDVRAWTAMIMGLGVHGRVGDALEVFHEMEEDESVVPNEVTFLAVLNACSHGGLVDAGRGCFERMVREYGITPGIEHYGCVIDLLGRAGLLEEAYLLINSLPTKGDAMAWRALLAACRVYGDVRHAELARQALVDLGDKHPTDSILLSSTYLMSGRRMDVAKFRDLEGEGMMDKKVAGCSVIEVNG
ncbi:putative pentatricopeptide repeat-containing protein-like, mitochondrial [Iris pallida]|uniref:Pentatricopeptide repeat-containing protein-like, mitochondrial n=1 Tax=Iris pallida TaxID=29817 RepID=A0AAX6EXF5_IRIPA|nr:putative pentatricopeptide repeat-containing protein-like, mitochondrial [Iris pallida]